MTKRWIGSAAIVAAMAGIAWWTGLQIGDGERVAVHFGLDGQPDRYGDRSEAIFILWLIVGIAAVTGVVMAVAARFLPRGGNIVATGRAYLILWMTALGILLFAQACIAASMLGWAALSMRMLVGGLAVGFAVIGNYMPKMRSNWVVGLRTPWTLSSETAWNATHRLTGRLLIVGGGVALVAALLAPQTWLVPVLVTVVMVPAVIGIVYSYVVWRKSDDKIGEPTLVDG
jgi:uncharacterized membrane protein